MATAGLGVHGAGGLEGSHSPCWIRKRKMSECEEGERKEEGGRQTQLQRTKSNGRELRQEEFFLKTQEMRGSRRLPGAYG